MSQKATRKSQNAPVISEEKEKVDTPVKEMKKKIAANAEKDKQPAEKIDKPTDKTEKNEAADKNKSTEKMDKNKSTEKMDKNKSTEKNDKNKPTEKTADKTDKNADKSDKIAEKTDKTAEKTSDKQEKATDKKSDKSGDKKADKSIEKKPEQAEKDESKGDRTKDKSARAVNGHNGAANGDDANGTVSDGSEGDLVIEEDEAFPELTYDDSDTDVEDAPSRSLTRRSQVKVTKTPETPAPRPASEKESEDSKESKVLKLNETVTPSDRKLRSADSPKPEGKKPDKKQDSPKKLDTVQEEEKKSSKKDLEATKNDLETADKKEPGDGMTGEKSDKMDVEIIEVESVEESAPRTRARVSPYTRHAARLDRTATSVTADYTGNNSTMEMDITESSCLEEPSPDDSGYLRGLRAIRGRASYKLLTDLQLSHSHAGRPRPPPAVPVRPTGAVVGRKRKPSAEGGAASPAERADPADPADPVDPAEDAFAAHGKRMKLLDRLSMPFRRSITTRAADLTTKRRTTEIVGINTDLPLTAPIASTSFAAFDPERIKAAPLAPAPGEPIATPLPSPPLAPHHDRDGKRCILM